MAGFLVVLADFDRRRSWERLGRASLFAFLHVELRLSNSAAFYRMNAARLLQRFPCPIEPLGDGRLCLSTSAELAKVLTEANYAQVAPRFFGLSAREAQELVAELQPRQVPATRVVVTRIESPTSPLPSGKAAPQPLLSEIDVAQPLLSKATAQQAHPDVVPLTQLLTSEVANGGGKWTHTPRDEAEPLTAAASARRPPRSHPRRRPSRRLAARPGALQLADRWWRGVWLDSPPGARSHRALGQGRRDHGREPSPDLQPSQPRGGAASLRRADGGAVPNRLKGCRPARAARQHHPVRRPA